MSEITYVVGVTAAELAPYPDRQRKRVLSERYWICDPMHPDTVKVIAFAYHSVAASAISAYTELGVPAFETTRENLPLLIEHPHQLVLAEDGNSIALWFGLSLSLVEKELRQRRLDEIVEGFKNPRSAREACWLLNARDTFFGRKLGVNLDDLSGSVRVTEWDILACKAVHRDGNAIYFEGEWRSMPLPAFWRRYGNPKMTPRSDLPKYWYFELLQANLPKGKRSRSSTTRRKILRPTSTTIPTISRCRARSFDDGAAGACTGQGE